MGSESHNSGKQKLKSGAKPPAENSPDAALTYVNTLGETGRQHPGVAPIAKQHDQHSPAQAIQDTAREQVAKLWEAHETPNEGSGVAALAIKENEQRPVAHAVSAKTSSHLSALPPRDSPLTKVFLGQYVGSLMQETIAYLKLSYIVLARQMSIPVAVLQEGVQGTFGLTRGQWVKLGHLLQLPTTFDLRPAEREGIACWEICYMPVSFGIEKK